MYRWIIFVMDIIEMGSSRSSIHAGESQHSLWLHITNHSYTMHPAASSSVAPCGILIAPARIEPQIYPQTLCLCRKKR